ncbi:MAG TPA: hypothetical protein PK264_18395 [Hyphomicrobiaceae bacterium]|nr:hypothetical protein [Hyphomicrobiaceae bacterium]
MDVAQIDQQTINELNGIVESRRLGAADQKKLANFVAGAIRPNRDRPVFDLVRIIAEIGAKVVAGKPPGRTDVDRCLAVLLGPVGAVVSNCKGKLPTHEIGPLMGFLEFLLMHSDCSYFAEMRRIIGELAHAPAAGREAAVKAAVSDIASRLRAYRTERFPVARHEKVFRSLLGYLGTKPRRTSAIQFDDEDIVAFWDSQIREGNRLLYRTVVKHFLTLETVAADVSAQRAMNDAVSLYDSDDGRVLAPVEMATENVEPIGDPIELRYEALVEFLRTGLPEGVKLLTGTERDRLADLAECGPFTVSRPLTALRYLSFGAVQSGIANFLRRGSGGSDVAGRVDCGDATAYPDVEKGYVKLADHLSKLLLISAFLAAPAGNDNPALASVEPDALAEARREGQGFLKRLKREGFDEAPDVLARSVVPVAGELVQIREVVQGFIGGVGNLQRGAELNSRFIDDKVRFAAAFRAAYLAPGGASTVPGASS